MEVSTRSEFTFQQKDKKQIFGRFQPDRNSLLKNNNFSSQTERVSLLKLKPKSFKASTSTTFLPHCQVQYRTSQIIYAEFFEQVKLLIFVLKSTARGTAVDDTLMKYIFLDSAICLVNSISMKFSERLPVVTVQNFKAFRLSTKYINLHSYVTSIISKILTRTGDILTKNRRYDSKSSGSLPDIWWRQW